MSRPLSRIFTIFSTIGANPTLSNIVISNSIMSTHTTHPTQRPHLGYTYFILVLVLYRSRLCPIQHRRSYDYTI